MIKGLYRAAGGMEQRMFEMDAISNNIANVNTTGYKKDSGFLNELIDTQLSLQVRNGEGNFIADNSYTVTDYSQGKLIPTGNPLDMALSGEGYFVVQTDQGERYTRNGNFKLNANSQLVTNNGELVMGNGGPIAIEGDELVIGTNGQIYVDGEEVNTVRVVNFDKPYTLRKVGDSLFENYQGIPVREADNYGIEQGFKEGSNVNMVMTMANMLQVQKNYDSNSKVLTTTAEVLRKLATEVGKL